MMILLRGFLLGLLLSTACSYTVILRINACSLKNLPVSVSTWRSGSLFGQPIELTHENCSWEGKLHVLKTPDVEIRVKDGAGEKAYRFTEAEWKKMKAFKVPFFGTDTYEVSLKDLSSSNSK